GLGIAAAHDREHAVFSARLAARHRCVNKAEARLLCLGIKRTRDFCRSGCMVDEHRAFLHTMERAVRPERHLAQIIVIADATHHEILACGCCFGRWRAAPAVLRDPFLGLRGGAVVDGDFVSALAPEMPRHRISHDAKTKKCDFHCLLLTRTAARPADTYMSDCDGAARPSTVRAGLAVHPRMRRACRAAEDVQ